MSRTTAGYRVLLVDDDPVVLASMEAILSVDFEVTAVASAQQALRLVQGGKYHVICSDWQMPIIDGIELFKQIGRTPPPEAVCCILISAHTAELLEQVDVADRKLLGFLRKPFKPADLIDRVTHFAALAEMKRTTRKLNRTTGGGTS